MATTYTLPNASGTMGDATDIPRPRVTPAERGEIDAGAHIDVRDDIAPVLDRWLDEEVRRARQVRAEKEGRITKWRQTMSGVRARPLTRTGASNLSVPLTMWARTGVRARIDQGVWEAKPILTVQPLRGREGPDATSNTTLANAIGRLLVSEMLNPRGLAARVAMTNTEAEIVDLGTSGLKVTITPDTVRKLAPAPGTSTPTRKVERGHVRWEYISRQDLLWFDGYGTDTQAMPFIGHEYEQIWGDIVAWGELGHYDEDVVKRVRGFYDSPGMRGGMSTGASSGGTSTSSHVDRPAALRRHDVAEIYLDYDVDGDGLPEAILVTWHIEARCRLRTVWNPVPSGRRPILMGNFDLPADLTCADGQGVCEKVEGVQDETDMIHNIAIEAGKRGAAHLIVIKADSRAEEELGPDEEILPGDIVATETPDEDVKAIPLGDPQAAQHTLGLEEFSRTYVTRMLGLDEARLGNMEAGKRVSAQVGMTTIREGRVVIRQALGAIRMMMTEAAYITIELWKLRPPTQALITIFTPEEMEALMSSVFGLSSDAVRSQFAIIVNAEDAATAQETRKNELMAINQFLFTFYERMQMLIVGLADPALPQPAKNAMVLIAQRMERGVEALLNTIDSIPNPEELLVSVSEMRGLLSQIASSAQPPADDGRPAIESTDLGGGVV